MGDIIMWVNLRKGYHIAGNFQGRKLSRISRFFSHPRKFSRRNSRHAKLVMRPVLIFREMLLSYRSAKVVSLENFLLYGNFVHFLKFYFRTLNISGNITAMNFKSDMNILSSSYYTRYKSWAPPTFSIDGASAHLSHSKIAVLWPPLVAHRLGKRPAQASNVGSEVP